MATMPSAASAAISQRTTFVASIRLTSHGVPQERTGHAVAAAAALAQLETGDLDHLDPRLAHLGDRVRVALVGHDDARLEGDDVVAVVPLLALLLVCVATG